MTAVITTDLRCDGCGSHLPCLPVLADGPRIKHVREIARNEYGWGTSGTHPYTTDQCPDCKDP